MINKLFQVFIKNITAQNILNIYYILLRDVLACISNHYQSYSNRMYFDLAKKIIEGFESKTKICLFKNFSTGRPAEQTGATKERHITNEQ